MGIAAHAIYQARHGEHHGLGIAAYTRRKQRHHRRHQWWRVSSAANTGIISSLMRKYRRHQAVIGINAQANGGKQRV